MIYPLLPIITFVGAWICQKLIQRRRNNFLIAARDFLLVAALISFVLLFFKTANH